MEVKSLEVVLTPEEKLARGQSLARVLEQLEEVEQERKAATQAAKAAKDRLTGERNTLMSAVSRGREFREIEIQSVSNFVSCTIDVVRQDTGEVVEGMSRAMTAAERQVKLFDINATKGKKKRAEPETEIVEDLT